MSPELTNLIETFNKLEHKTGLYLKFPNEFIIPDNPREFLFLFLTNYNNNYNTHDKEREEKENWNYSVTQTGRRRSVNEVFDVIKFYFPNYTVLEYFKDIYDVVFQIFKSGGSIVCHYCCNIQRFVFLINSRHYEEFRKGGHLDLNENFPYYFVWVKSLLSDMKFWNNFNNSDICMELTGGKYINKEENKKT